MVYQGKRSRRRKGRINLAVLGIVGVLCVSVVVLRHMVCSADAGTAPETEVTIPQYSGLAPMEVKVQVPTDGSIVPESEPVENDYFSSAVFLGDSRTEGFHLYSGLREGTCLYATGATVETVFSKPVWQGPSGKKEPLLKILSHLQPERVYIMLGVNELGWVKSEAFYNQYAKVVDQVRADNPDAKIFLQSIMPVTAKKDAQKSYVNNQRIKEYNELILKLAKEKKCWYVDVVSAVQDNDGCLRADFATDGVHLNRPGCQAWLHYLRTHAI